MVSKKTNTFLSTLNFVLFFIGYQLVTSLFLPISSDIENISQSVTVPYRAAALLIMIFVFGINSKNNSKAPIAVKILWVYWAALIVRIFYDTTIRTGVYIKDIEHLWLYIFGIILPAMISIRKSFNKINFEKALNWIYLGVIATMILSLFNNPELLSQTDEYSERGQGNLALNTIAFGHVGTMGVLLSLFLLFRKKLDLWKKIIIPLGLILSFFIIIRSGSRSPILALIVVLLFWTLARGKNVILSFSIITLIIILLSIYIEPVLLFIGDISPIMEWRLRLAIFEGDSSGRNILFNEAFNLFLDSPLIGSQFALFYNFGEFGYPHNIILEAFMSLGILGGISMIYILWMSIKIAYNLIKNKDPNFWVCLILIQQVVLGMLGHFYYNQILNILFEFILMYGHNSSKVNSIALDKK